MQLRLGEDSGKSAVRATSRRDGERSTGTVIRDGLIRQGTVPIPCKGYLDDSGHLAFFARRMAARAPRAAFALREPEELDLGVATLKFTNPAVEEAMQTRTGFRNNRHFDGRALDQVYRTDAEQQAIKPNK